MSSQPVPVSYAEAARPSAENNERPLGWSVNRKNSDDVSSGHAQRLSVVTIEEPPGASTRTPLRSSLVSHSRRPSIAHVLSKISSRASATSESMSRLSSSTNIPTLPPFEEVVTPKSGRRKRKPRSKHRRKRSATHFDFLAAQNRGIDTTLSQAEESTPLVAAITDGDIEKVTELLRTYDPTINYGGKLPLQAAALTGNEDVVRILLEAGRFDINARDSKERTALYVATAKGYENISTLLLKHHAMPLSSKESKIAKLELKRWKEYESRIGVVEDQPLERTQTLPATEMVSEPEEKSSNQIQRSSVSQGGSDDGDHISRLQASSVDNTKEMEDSINQKRHRLQQRGEWVTGPIQAPQLSQEEKEILESNRHPRYPGFGFEVPIVEFDFTGNGKHRIVRPNLDDLLYGSEEAETIGKGNNPDNSTVLWYHLPANNLGWAEDLIRKIYEKRSPKEQQKRDIILHREPFANIDRDNINSTLLDPRPQSRSLRPQYRSITLDRDGTTRKSSAISMHIPFAHWETEESRAEMHHVMEAVRKARRQEIEGDKGAVKKLPDLKAIQNRKDWSKNEKLLCAYLYNSPPVHPRRTLDQFYYHMLEDTEHRDQDQVITRFYHNAWRKEHGLPEDEEEFKAALPSTEKPTFTFSLNPPRYSKYEMSNGKTEGLSPNGSGHSLPQSMLRKRHSTKVEEPGEFETTLQEQRYVLMVDQLWLWILDDNTIITSFPQNWIHEDEHKNVTDRMDVLQSIYQWLSLVNRPPLETVYDIAQLIVYKCLASFCTKSTPYGAMQILDVYEGAIATVTDKETRIFSDFATKSKQKLSHEQLSSRDRSEELYNINEEIEQLKEIKDIQDELHILSVLLDQQATVLHQAAHALEKNQSTDGNISNTSLPINHMRVKSEENIIGQVAPYSSTNNFAKLHSMVVEQQKRRKGLEVQAEQANKALNHLLDLKQKQANVSEARSARWTAESTKQQGNIMVLFTLVTIVFAPLSLMVTIFQLNIVEFPQNLHLDYVIKYMFVVSIAVIVPLLGLVIYTTRVAVWKLYKRVETRIVNRNWFPKKQMDLVSERDETDDGMESDSILGKENKKPTRERFWGKSSKEKGFDAESGRTFVETKAR